MKKELGQKDSLKVLEYVSRIAGMFFIASGAVCSFLAVDLINDDVASLTARTQLANSISSDESGDRNVSGGVHDFSESLMDEEENNDKVIDDVTRSDSGLDDEVGTEKVDEESKTSRQDDTEYDNGDEYEYDDRLIGNSAISQTDDTSTAEKEESPEIDLEPDVKFNIGTGQHLKDIFRLEVKVEDAKRVELYIRQDGALTKKYVGTTMRASDSVWVYKWDTRQLPNSNYSVFAEVKNAYGTYTSPAIRVNIINERTVEHSEEEKEYIKTVVSKAEEVEKVEKELVIDIEAKTDEEVKKEITEDGKKTTATTDDRVETTAPKTISNTLPVQINAAHPESEKKEVTESDKQSLERYVVENMDDVREAISIGVRTQNDTNKAYVDTGLETLKNRTVDLYMRGVPRGSLEYDKLRGEAEALVSEVIEKEKEEVVRKETIIRDRVGEEVFADTDKDGISDYDEVNIYNTDPFVADTDADGFIDGSEILSGFDPNDPGVESPIVFEDPKETGIVRADLLSVDVVESHTKKIDDDVEESLVSSSTEPAVPTARIMGRALPNSFVTLYVFSSPIIVTVKTQSDGSWEYIFDKEIEDGTHEVYVGVTDNAGKIIAKSEPFTFVKVAQAFTPVEAAETVAPQPAPEPPMLFNDHVMLLALSLGVVAIGLLLMVIGAFIKNRREYTNEIQYA